jgi:hypothetical protein
MLIQYQTLTTVALDADGFANDVAYAAGGYALSATTPDDGTAHKVTFTNNSTTDYTGANITFTGTDADGQAVTQTLAGPDASDVITTTQHFATLTSVTSDTDTMADTFDIGWTADAVGPMLKMALERNPVTNTEVFCRVPTTGPTYSLEYTADTTPAGLDDATSWLTHATITGKTGTFDGQITAPILAIRLHLTAAGTVNMTVVEPYHA